ncbi:hypothetical protein [Cryobacterium zhongshanensis]|uniref:Uncharacterized protein n=1 Tax=Cryobacterium zhongshanensis TaxID=2928153 RepID=A0AA41QX28_9MICO|nr:hypothetical protein [Cryobacterium zhongshanensis]MCI4658935.1 hypothetical protein [Cryobacterium zhongshanensis]
MDLLAVYGAALGARPSALSTLPKLGFDRLGEQELARLLESWGEARTQSESPSAWDEGKGQSIWPLISHHNFHASSPFGVGNNHRVSDRALRMLLIHDGIMLSDPVHEIALAFARHGTPAGVDKMRAITERLGRLEPLIERGYIKFTTERPAIADSTRRGTLEALGMRPDFRDFTDLREVSAGAAEAGGAFVRDYLWIAGDLLRRLGESNNLPPSTAFPDSRTYVSELVRRTDRRLSGVAQALIHLSWQLAICSVRPDADIATTGDLELRLFRRLVDTSTLVSPDHEDDPIDTRHVRRTAIGDIPNLAGSELDVGDLVAIREDPTYEQFRSALRVALDDYDEWLVRDPADKLSHRRFTEQMATVTAHLQESTVRSSFGEYVKREWFPATVTVAVAAASVGQSAASTIAVGGLGAAAQAIVHWWTARHLDDAHRNRPAVRFLASLGNPRT